MADAAVSAAATADVEVHVVRAVAAEVAEVVSEVGTVDAVAPAVEVRPLPLRSPR